MYFKTSFPTVISQWHLTIKDESINGRCLLRSSHGCYRRGSLECKRTRFCSLWSIDLSCSSRLLHTLWSPSSCHLTVISLAISFELACKLVTCGTIWSYEPLLNSNYSLITDNKLSVKNTRKRKSGYPAATPDTGLFPHEAFPLSDWQVDGNRLWDWCDFGNSLAC